MFAFSTQSVQFINTMYKAFGQQFIHDDHFLAFVGSIASIFNAGGRLFWGNLFDKTSFRVCINILSGMLSILMLTFELTAYYESKLLFFTWVVSIFFTFSGIFVIFPTACAQVFGRMHAGTIYGILFTAPVCFIYNFIFKFLTLSFVGKQTGTSLSSGSIHHSIGFERFGMVWIIFHDINVLICR